MKSFLFQRPSLFAFALLPLVSLSARAADEAKKTPSVEADRSASKTQPSHITLDFPGGSIAQLIATVHKLGGPPFNVIGERDDLATELPSFSVRNVQAPAFAMALRQLLEPRGLAVMPESNDMFVIRKLSTLRGSEPNAFESFQLGPYLEKQSIDDIVGAIRAAWELSPANKAEALQIKFHPPTKLLLVSGTSSAINVASKVISTLPGGSEKIFREPKQNIAPPAKR